MGNWIEVGLDDRGLRAVFTVLYPSVERLLAGVGSSLYLALGCQMRDGLFWRWGWLGFGIPFFDLYFLTACGGWRCWARIWEDCTSVMEWWALRFLGRVFNRGYMIFMTSMSYCGHQIPWVLSFTFGLKVVV